MNLALQIMLIGWIGALVIEIADHFRIRRLMAQNVARIFHQPLDAQYGTRERTSYHRNQQNFGHGKILLTECNYQAISSATQ